MIDKVEVNLGSGRAGWPVEGKFKVFEFLFSIISIYKVLIIIKSE